MVDFTNNSVGKYVSYLWDFGFDNFIGTDSTSNDTVPSDRSYPAGIYFDTTYYTSLTVSNYCGVSVQNLDIISMPVPVSRFGPYSNVGGCASGTITLANNSYGLPDSFIGILVMVHLELIMILYLTIIILQDLQHSSIP